MQLSVILSTRNNAPALGRLLQALAQCDAPDSWECLIVDNGSTDATRQTIEHCMDKLPLHYLYQPLPGKSISLNLALREAQGEVILFTDDDVIPEPGWLLAHIRAMRDNPEVRLLGGRIRVDPARLPRWLARAYNLRGMLVSEHDRGEAACRYGVNDYPFGPNMSVRRKALAGLARPWPEDTGPGTGMPLGDEVVFGRTVSAADGSDRLYDPACEVTHCPVTGPGFFRRAVLRCFKGGYIAGRYALPQPRGTGARRSTPALIAERLGQTASLRELVCVVSRALGHAAGSLRNAG